MTEKLHVPREFQLAIKPIFSKYKKIYSANKLGITDLDSAHAWFGLAEIYYTECSEKQITSDDIYKYGLEVISRPSYSTFPPTPRGFACEMASIKEELFIKKTIPENFTYFFDWLNGRYLGRWVFDSKMDTLKSWVDFLSVYDKNDFNLDRAISIIRNSSDYQKYPPNNAQIERVLMLASSEADIPDASEAFFLATSDHESSELPDIVRYARYRFGSYSLRVRSDAMVRREFMSFYESIVDQYLKGDINIDRMDNVNKNKNKDEIEPIADRDKALNLIVGM